MQYSDSNVRLHPTWTKRWNILKKKPSLQFVVCAENEEGICERCVWAM